MARFNKIQKEIYDATLNNFESASSEEIIDVIKSKKSEREHLWSDCKKIDAEIAALSNILEDRGDFNILNEEENFDGDTPTLEEWLRRN